METPRKIEQSPKPERRPGEVISNRPDEVQIRPSPFYEGKPPKPKKEKGFDEQNLMGVKIGDKIPLDRNGKIDKDWEILEIDPKTGEAQLYKDGEFEKANVNDFKLAGLNKLSKKPLEEIKPHKTNPEHYARIIKIPEDLLKTKEAEAAIPFEIGQEVTVKRTLGNIESGWKVIAYDADKGRVGVMKGRKHKNVKLDKLLEWNK